MQKRKIWRSFWWNLNWMINWMRFFFLLSISAFVENLWPTNKKWGQITQNEKIFCSVSPSNPQWPHHSFTLRVLFSPWAVGFFFLTQKKKKIDKLEGLLQEKLEKLESTNIEELWKCERANEQILVQVDENQKIMGDMVFFFFCICVYDCYVIMLWLCHPKK